jgi:hypothetical protein
VAHVKILENIMQGIPDMKVQDRVAAGFFLWMIQGQGSQMLIAASATDGPDGFIFQLRSTGDLLRYHVGDEDEIFGDVSKPCTPGEHQNSW